MNEEKREGAFIPCGDSLERIQEIRNGDLGNITGGKRIPTIERKGICPVCGDDMLIHTDLIPWIPISDPASRYSYYCCGTCNYQTDL